MIDKIWDALNTRKDMDIETKLYAIQTLIENEIENFRADDGKVYNELHYIRFETEDEIQSYPLSRIDGFIDEMSEGNTLVDALKLIAFAAKCEWGAVTAEVTLFDSFILVNIYYDDDWCYVITIDVEV